MQLRNAEQRSHVVAALSPAMRTGAGPLAQLIREGGLHCVFQPLGDLRAGTVFAHEALIRGPEGSPLHRPDTLLDMARCERILPAFELMCAYNTLLDLAPLRAPRRLLLNITSLALVP